MKYLVCLFILILSSVHAGAIYTWVDEHGKTNYGDSPPASATSKKVKVDPAPSNPGPPLPKLDTTEPETAPPEPAKPDTTIQPEQAKQFCDMAHREIRNLNNARHRARVRNADGGTTHMTTSERKARRESANKDIEEFCE